MSRKRKLIVSLGKPKYIYKEIGDGRTSQTMTIMIGKYALPWSRVTNVPCCGAVLNKVQELKSAFPDARIQCTTDVANPTFFFTAVGRTKQSEGDKFNQEIGNKVAKAKAMARACVISRAIIREAKKVLVKELNRSEDILTSWYIKEQKKLEEF